MIDPAVVFAAVFAWTLELAVDARQAGVGLAVSAVTHYVADRRAPLAAVARWIGKADYWRLGSGTLASGAAYLDQSWHWMWLGVAALVTAA